MSPPQLECAGALRGLSPALLQALFPLCLHDTWHPVRSLAVAPDLPDDWWSVVTRQLPLERQPDGSATVPRDLGEALRAQFAATAPQRYRAACLARSEELLERGDLHGALGLLDALGEHERAQDALEEWMTVRIHRGEHELLQATVDALAGLGDSPRTRAVYWLSCVSVSSRDRAAGARRAAHAAYDAGDRNPRLMHMLSSSMQFDGEYELSLRLVEEGLALGPKHTDRLRIRHQEVMGLNYLRRQTEHLAAARVLLEDALAQGNVYFAAVAHATLAYAHEDKGDRATAETHYQRATALYRQISQGPQLATLLNNSAQSLAADGRPAEALEQLAEAERLPGTALRHRGWIGLTRATVYHQYGQHTEALTLARTAAQDLHAAHLPGDEMVALQVEAERLAMDGRPQEARGRWREAQALLADDPVGAAQLQFAHGVLTALGGDRDAARTAFLAALDGDLTPWDRARAQLHLIALDLAQGRPGQLGPLDQALAAVGTDFPLLTDAPQRRDVLTWLAAQPGWGPRVSAVFARRPLAGRLALRVELFGPLGIHGPDGPLRFPLRRSGELLAYLALHGPATRAQLLAALFEGRHDARTIDLFKKALRGLRDTLRPLLPGGLEPVVVEGGRHELQPLLDVTTAWVPDGVFPAPGVRRSGPLVVKGAFVSDVTGPWADDIRALVHAQLHDELRRRERGGDPTVAPALRVVRGLV